MKKLLLPAVSAVTTIAFFSGCVTELNVDNPVEKRATWNQFFTGSLVTKYPGKTIEEVYQAANKGLDQAYGPGCRKGENRPIGENSKQEPFIEIVARVVGDIRVTVHITTAKDPRAGKEWTQVTVQYGAGNLGESQRIVSAISRNL
ncbi:MAG: hypothetical protein LBS59_07140 [Puniceicoccales bacterium]|nr:hypothetical protein [Puniceicoccales bacterium]